MSVVKRNIILSSRDQVNEFLCNYPDPDETIIWVCPNCGIKNNDNHFCRETRCECKKFMFPRIVLPIKGDGKTIKDILFTNKLKEISNSISQYQNEILDFEGEIEEREEWIYDLIKESKMLKDLVNVNDQVSGM
jgi:hypothetical protein